MTKTLEYKWKDTVLSIFDDKGVLISEWGGVKTKAQINEIIKQYQLN